MKRNAFCPCHSGHKYCDCCQKYHRGLAAETALILMKSRYAAYALGLADYIIQTTHPLCPQFSLNTKEWAKEIRHFTHQTRFENLQIIEFIEEDEKAYVTFRATLTQAGRDVSFTEKSRFLRQEERWLYIDGIFLC